MENILTNVDVMKFLDSVERGSSVEILEEGKEKNDLINSAKKRGILVEGSRDLGVLKTIFLFTDVPNSNGAIIPSKEFQKIFPQIIGKPMNVGHNRRAVVGFYTDYRYIQKENKAITYAVIFKSNFPDVYKKAKDFQKIKKLSSSFEIWSDNKKIVSKKEGTYSLNKMELAGGALIFQENGEMPAFEGADVLAIGKKDLAEIVNDKCLCFASKYKNGKIICANGECEEAEFEVDKEVVEKPTQPVQTILKIKCSNCGEGFEYNGIDTRIKCPKCFAILNKEGVMQYPPQIKDFQMLCPSCKVNNWLILSKKEDVTKLRCLQCSKEYQITFDTKKSNELLKKLTFVYCGNVSCYQCGRTLYYSGVSSVKERTFKCSKCGLEFSYNLVDGERYKKIAKIEEIKAIKTSEQGGKEEMIKEKVEETKVESKKDETKETPKVEEAPKAEKKEDKKPKKVEEKKEPAKAEVKEEKKTEAKVESKEEKVEVKEKAKEQPEVKAEEAPKAEAKAKEKVETPKEEVKVENDEAKSKAKEQDKKDSFKCSCVDCGHKMTSEKHCVNLKCPKCGGQMRRAKRPGDGKPEEKKEKAVKAPEVKAEVKASEKKVEPKVEETTEGLKAEIERLNTVLKTAKEDAKKEIDFYKENAIEINERKKELGDFAEKISDKDILDDEKFTEIKAGKENASIENAEVVGKKTKGADEYAKLRKEIDRKAFEKI